MARTSFKLWFFSQLLKRSKLGRKWFNLQNPELKNFLVRAMNQGPYVFPKIKLKSSIQKTAWENFELFILNDQNDLKQKIIFYIHGGAWIFPPRAYHWVFLDKIIQATNAKIFVYLYPKVPKYNCKDVIPKCLSLYEDVAQKYSKQKIIVMGDSAGAQIGLILGHQINALKLKPIDHLILISPVPDFSFVNHDLKASGKNDVMVGDGELIRTVRDLWIADYHWQDPYVSPLYGDFHGYCPTIIFVGGYEILYPDCLLLYEKLRSCNVAAKFRPYPKMPHSFLLWPIKDAKLAIAEVIEIINSH